LLFFPIACTLLALYYAFSLLFLEGIVLAAPPRPWRVLVFASRRTKKPIHDVTTSSMLAVSFVGGKCAGNYYRNETSYPATRFDLNLLCGLNLGTSALPVCLRE
jgi:hypothetical protein